MPIRPNSPRADKIAARRAGQRVALRAFDESKVTRDDTGKFGSGSGGGGDKPKSEKPKRDKKPKQTPEERKAEQAKQAAANREAVGNELNEADNEQLSRAGIDGLAAIRSGAPNEMSDTLIEQGLAVRGRDGRVRLTPEGKKIVNAADKGDTQAVLDAVSEAGDKRAAREERQAAREQKRAEREAKRAERERARAERGAAKPKPAAQPKPSGGGGGGRREDGPPVGGRDLFGTLGKAAQKAMRPGRRKLWRATYAEAKAAGLAPADARQRARQALQRDVADRAARTYERAVGRLAVFKDARGADRWAAISSTAYRDRDGEIVSTTALRGAVALADAGGQARGPLRFWHAPGLDLGDCDFQALAADGRVLIESGTFRRPAYAQAVKAVARDYQMSIGFTHPATEPDPAGVFRTIQIFERSLVPAGRASNPFTRITTKERTMDIAPDKLAALKALLGDQGAQELLSGAQQTDKAAQAAGVAYKSADAPAVYTLPDGTPGVIVGGQFVALKAATEKAPMPPAQMMQAAMTEAADAGAELAAEGAEPEPAVSDDTDVMDLTVGEFKAVLAGAVEELITGYNTKMAEMKQQYEAMGKAFGQMQQQKDDSAAQAKAVTETVAGLKAQQEAIAARLKELEGDAAPAARRAQGGEPAAVLPAPQTVKTASTPEQDAYNLIWGAAD